MNTREKCADAVQQVHLLLPNSSPMTNPDLESLVPPDAVAECKSNKKLMRYADDLQACPALASLIDVTA